MRCDHRGSDTTGTLVYPRDEPTNTQLQTAKWESRGKKTQICIFATCVLKSVCHPSLPPPVSSLSLCPHFGGGDSIWTSKPLHHLWETAWLRGWKKKKNKEKKKEERASEWGNVSGVFRAPDDAILSRNTASAPPMAAHAWADARRVSTATPNLPQHQSFPSHNPPPPPPPSLSISLLFHPPLLCLGINVKQLINTAVHEEAVPNDRHSWSICQDSPTHSYRRKAVTHSRIHTDMLNKADYTLPMIDVTSVEDSFVYFVLSPREHSTLQASG